MLHIFSKHLLRKLYQLSAFKTETESACAAINQTNITYELKRYSATIMVTIVVSSDTEAWFEYTPELLHRCCLISNSYLAVYLYRTEMLSANETPTRKYQEVNVMRNEINISFEMTLNQYTHI